MPVLMLSARAGEEARVEGLQAGADDYLVKPFSARELVARVEAQLLRAESDAVEEAHDRRLATIFAHAPVAIAILRGPQHVFELANESYLRSWSARRRLIGRPCARRCRSSRIRGSTSCSTGVCDRQPFRRTRCGSG